MQVARQGDSGCAVKSRTDWYKTRLMAYYVYVKKMNQLKHNDETNRFGSASNPSFWRSPTLIIIFVKRKDNQGKPREDNPLLWKTHWSSNYSGLPFRKRRFVVSWCAILHGLYWHKVALLSISCPKTGKLITDWLPTIGINFSNEQLMLDHCHKISGIP